MQYTMENLYFYIYVEKKLPKVKDVFKKYNDQAIDLADVVLLQLAQRENIKTIFTTDHRHFRLFRLQNGEKLRLLPENV
jgi:predicted nucleic acid-binding protein